MIDYCFQSFIKSALVSGWLKGLTEKASAEYCRTNERSLVHALVGSKEMACFLFMSVILCIIFSSFNCKYPHVVDL